MNKDNEQLAVDSRQEEGRRLMIVEAHPQVIIQLLNWWRDPVGSISIPDFEALPGMFKVVSVNTSWKTGVIQILIESDEFEPVPLGVKPPKLPDPFYSLEIKSLRNNKVLINSLEWIAHHALQDGCDKKSIKAVAKSALEAIDHPPAPPSKGDLSQTETED